MDRNEQAGVERVVSAELLADCRDAISGEPNFCRFRGQVGIGERRVDGEQRLTRLRRRAEQPREHRCVEQVVAHQEREAPIPESSARSENRQTVLQLPVGIVEKVHGGARRDIGFDEGAQRACAVAEHDVKRVDPCLARRVQRSKDQRLAQNRLQEL